MNNNESDDMVVEKSDPGLADGGDILALPRFAPPEPEVPAQAGIVAQDEPLTMWVTRGKHDDQAAPVVGVQADDQAAPVVGVQADDQAALVVGVQADDQAAPVVGVQEDDQAAPVVGVQADDHATPVVARETGVLVDHGEAKFNFDPKESGSYFVKYRDDSGVEKVLWGIDLRRAVRDGGIEIGQRVDFVNVGQESVQVNAPVRNEAGEVTRYELKQTMRNMWEVRPALSPLHQIEQKMSDEDQLRELSAQILGRPDAKVAHRATHQNDGELARVARHLNVASPVRPDAAGPSQAAPSGAISGSVDLTSGQRTQLKGGGAFAEGLAALAGGALNLAGTAGKVVGNAANGIADMMKSGQAKPDAPISVGEPKGGMPAMLPRLSEYRVQQVEKAATRFANETDAFWKSSSKLTALRAEMERVAQDQGLSMLDVVEKMKPGGEMADLRQKFNDAVDENPEAGARRKALDKALNSYVNQFGRAQEELLSPEQQDSDGYKKFKKRLDETHETMEKNSAGVPAFANDKGELEPSHLERLKEGVAKIMAKIKEVAQDFVALFRGKTGGAGGGDDHAPGP